MEQIILRSTSYPKKGSNEWVLSNDSIEFRVIEREKKNQTHLREAITASQLDLKKNRLDLYVDIGRKNRLLQVLWFAPESLATAKKIHDILDTNLQAQMNKLNQRVEETVKRNDESTKTLEQIGNALDALERHIDCNVFTKAELQEIIALKSYGIDVKNQQTELLKKCITLTEETTRLVKMGIRRNDPRVADIDDQIAELNKKLFALYDKNPIQLENLRKWLELGQQRAK